MADHNRLQPYPHASPIHISAIALEPAVLSRSDAVGQHPSPTGAQRMPYRDSAAMIFTFQHPIQVLERLQCLRRKASLTRINQHQRVSIQFCLKVSSSGNRVDSHHMGWTRSRLRNYLAIEGIFSECVLRADDHRNGPSVSGDEVAAVTVPLLSNVEDAILSIDVLAPHPSTNTSPS